MKKTFITDSDKTFIEHYLDKASDIKKKVSELCRDAIDEIINLFECFDVNTIDVIDYDEDYRLTMYNDCGEPSFRQVKKVELYEGTIYVHDTDDFLYGSEEWYNEAPELLNVLTECLKDKFKDIESLEVGKKVRWIDPEIEDYDEEDRQEVLDRVFTIYECPDVIERDSIIRITDGSSEAEVLPMELVLMPD